VAIAMPDTLPVTFLDCTMVISILETGRGLPQMGTAVSFGARVDESRLERALRLLLDAEPVLGCSLDSRAGKWRRLDPGNLDGWLQAVDARDPESEAIAFAAAPLDPSDGPQVRALLLRSPEKDSLVLKASHAAVDGLAALEAAGLIGRFYRALAVDSAWTPTANNGAVRDFRSASTAMGMRERLKLIRSEDTRDPPSDWSIPYEFRRGGETYATGSIEPVAFLALKDAGRNRGATVNDLLTTALYRSLWRVLRSSAGDKTPLTATADLRGAFPPGTRLGLANFSAPWWVKISREPDEDFDGTLSRVVARTVEWKRNDLERAAAIGMGSVEGWMHGWRGVVFRRMLHGGIDRVKADIKSSPGRTVPVLSNIGIIDEKALDFGPELPVDDVRFFGPIGLGPWIGLSASTFRNRLELSTGFDAEALDTELMRGIVDATVRELEEWASSA